MQVSSATLCADQSPKREDSWKGLRLMLCLCTEDRGLRILDGMGVRVSGSGKDRKMRPMLVHQAFGSQRAVPAGRWRKQQQTGLSFVSSFASFLVSDGGPAAMA